MKTKKFIISLFSFALLAGFSVTDASAVSVRVGCERGAGFSKASVDGRGLAAGNYKAQIISGGNVRTSGLSAADANREVQKDFSSKLNDVNAGATRIVPNFIGTPAIVTGKILNAAGFTIVSDTVVCRVR